MIHTKLKCETPGLAGGNCVLTLIFARLRALIARLLITLFRGLRGAAALAALVRVLIGHRGFLRGGMIPARTVTAMTAPWFHLEQKGQ